MGAPPRPFSWTPPTPQMPSRLSRLLNALRTRLTALRAAPRVWLAERGLRTLLLLCLPAVIALVIDACHRGPHLWQMSRAYKGLYLLAWFESCLVWGLLLYATGRRSLLGHVSSALFVLGFTFALGGQVYFFEQYRAYLTQDLTLFAVNLTESVVNQLAVDITRYLGTNAPFLFLAVGLVVACRTLMGRQLPPRRRVAIAAPLVFVGCWFVPLKFRAPQAATPDTLYLNAMGAYLRSQLGATVQSRQVRPHTRHSRAVPPVTPARETPRNVLFILGESVRADAVCSAYDPKCTLTPHTNPLLSGRHALEQHRAMDSTTAISVAVLWSGVAPTESEEVLHTWPLLFDYAHAAGYTTAYWTSQNLFFANSHLFVENLGVDQFVSATQLDMNADMDMGADERLLADHVIDHIDELPEPYFVMLHTSNVHYPYLVNKGHDQPFQPAEFTKDPDGLARLRNYYQNAVVQQDAHLARIIEALRKTDAGKRTVILYTSDHGEAFRDHNQMGHTFSLFDEEVRVPAFVDAPEDTLSPSERENLARHATEFTFHPDLTATAIDLMGVWRSSAIAEFKPKLAGRSLLEPVGPVRQVPMTNCSALWSCAFENWGLMAGSHKVFARTPYDTGWQCFDLVADPGEMTNLDTPRCRELVQNALGIYGRAPL